MTDYLDPDDVDELIDEKGFHYRDRGLMLSALAAPLPVFGEEVHVGVHRKAAALITAINRDHPLLDGNKRLGWYLTCAFYEFNGFELWVDAAEGDHDIRLIAAGDLSLDEVTAWLERHAHPL